LCNAFAYASVCTLLRHAAAYVIAVVKQEKPSMPPDAYDDFRRPGPGQPEQRHRRPPEARRSGRFHADREARDAESQTCARACTRKSSDADGKLLEPCTALTIEGVSIPDSTLAREVTGLVRDTESPLLFHHFEQGLLLRRFGRKASWPDV
jgi:hypothetical protein